MVKNNKFVKVSGVIILTLVLMLSVNIASAANPPGSGEYHPAGPAIVAEITFTPADYDDEGTYCQDGLAFEGTGKCGGSPVIIPNDLSLVCEHSFSAVNKDSLLDFIVTFPTGWPMAPGGGPADCIPINKEGDYPVGMIIRAVTDFDEGDDTYKWAKVILLFTVD